VFNRAAGQKTRGIIDRLAYGGVFDSFTGAFRRKHPVAHPQDERALRRMGDFYAALLAMASHDLRQPVQTIVSMHTLLERRLTDSTERTFLERGQQAAGRLIEQLDQLTEALRIQEQAGKIVSGPVAIEPLFARMYVEYAEAAHRRGLALHTLPRACNAISDRVLLEAILRNLLRNALSYTRTGGRVLLACRRSGTLLKLEVYDTGIGIAGDELDCIFDAFHRSSATPSGGFGLGLFIVRRAADALGHRIEVRTRPGHGSRFRIILEAASAARSGPASNPPGELAADASRDAAVNLRRPTAPAAAAARENG
jgi:two-component system phosphate regulon sensor histidine kinase PhoR